MSSMWYEGSKSLIHINDTQYEVYTGVVLDERIASIVRFAEGEISLQEVYTDLLLHDKNLLLEPKLTTMRLQYENVVYSNGAKSGTVFSNKR